MWFDDLQREPGGDRRVERIAAQFQHSHAGTGAEPVSRRHHPERATQLWASGERRHRTSADSLGSMPLG
jgi:hypothetical protein